VLFRSLIIVVSEWARGEPIDFMSYKWMTERDIVIAWGQWLARFHAVSKRFSTEHPSIARNIQCWDEMHHSILKGSELHHDDVAVMDDIEHYGVLHGDLNISNFFYIPGADGSAGGTLSVFDWDQVQQGWYLWDVAQSELTAYMLAEAGSVVDGSPVPQANPQQFEAWMVEGYESVAGKGSVDRARLGRMVTLRKRFYQKFCTTAKAQGDVPADMAHFINYVIAWFEKVPLT
jgi:Ser/Thr protein kinase RdoA (MazF antagonist)